MTKHYEFKDDYPGIICVTKLFEWMEREREFQAAICESDPRHWEMFRFYTDESGGEWVDLFWGGKYGYPCDLSEIERPEDLLWLLVHLSEKARWKHFKGFRVGALIKEIARRKGWPPHGRAPHPNEAPVPNEEKVRQRRRITPELRYRIIKRDLYRCRACGLSVADGAILHVDHIQPVSKGGGSEESNLQTLCASCNLGKSCA